MTNQDVRNVGPEYYSWEWTAVTGVLLVVLGAVVVGTSYLATIVISWLLGLAFLVSGITQLIHAFRISREHGSLMRFMLAAVSIVAGVVILRVPADGAMGITLVLGFYLLFSAAAKGMLVIETKRNSTRRWLVLSSLVSGALGIYLLVTFPVTSLPIPGAILGVDLVFYGVFELAVSATVRKGDPLAETIKFRSVA